PMSSTELYTPSLHDALPIYVNEHPAAPGERQDVDRQAPAAERERRLRPRPAAQAGPEQREVPDQVAQVDHPGRGDRDHCDARVRSEEHTSELQSPDQLVCRL